MRDGAIQAVPPHRPRAWTPTHRLFFPVPNQGHIDVMFLANRLDGGRDGFTHLDWSTDGRPQFSLSADGEWLRDGKPFAGRVELLGRLGVRSLCA